MGNRITSTAGSGSSTYSSNELNQYTGITTPGEVNLLSRSPSSVSATLDGQSATITQQGNLYSARATLANSPNGRYFTASISSGSATQTGKRWLAPAAVVPQYDDDGNLKTDGRWTYTWDAENRLVKMETLASAITAGAPNLTITNTYDFQGRRIARKVEDPAATPSSQTTCFLYQAWNPVVEFTKTGTSGQMLLSKKLLWGLDLSGTPQGAGGVGGLLLITDHSAPVTSYLPSYDTNGNIIAWTTASGQLIRRQDYDPFGTVILKEDYAAIAQLDTILNYGFSTKPQDLPTGLLYYGYRFYDPAKGHWLNKDPIEEEGGANLYVFVGNSSINSFDYLGCILKQYNGPTIHPNTSFKGSSKSGSAPSSWTGYVTWKGGLNIGQVTVVEGELKVDIYYDSQAPGAIEVLTHEQRHSDIWKEHWNYLEREINWLERGWCKPCGSLAIEFGNASSAYWYAQAAVQQSLFDSEDYKRINAAPGEIARVDRELLVRKRARDTAKNVYDAKRKNFKDAGCFTQ